MLEIKLIYMFCLLISTLAYKSEEEIELSTNILHQLIEKMSTLSQKYDLLYQKYDMLTQKYDETLDKLGQQDQLIQNLNAKVLSLEKEAHEVPVHKEVKLHPTVKNNTIEERISHLEELAKTKVLRSCEELHQHGVRISSHYHVDPDGENTGFPPIRVYCNFEDQVTEIIHDSDDEIITIGHCTGEHCYKKQFIYEAPMEQITALISLSSTCSQTLVYDCYLAPLFYNNVQIGTWTDRFGQDQVYFTGSNYGQHKCICYEDNSCFNQEIFNTTCNCDSTGVPQWMEDSGDINNSTALPITAFNYGPLEFEAQEAKVMVGRLRCSGAVDFNSPPLTCNDLKKSGETQSGLYPLHDGENDQYPKLSYCDMSVAGYDGDMESTEGWIKFSSGPDNVVFSVQHLPQDDITNGAVITYDNEMVNKGNCMNMETGVFTARTAGLYQFSFSALRYGPHAGDMRVDIYVNGNKYLQIYGQSTDIDEVSRTWVLDMESGNTVYLVLTEGGMCGSPYTPEFVGKLI